jgi:hypothetical protein
MKRRTGRASLLHPLTLLPSPPNPLFLFFLNFYDISELIFGLYKGGELTAIRRSGWTSHTVVGYGSLVCRRNARQFVASRRGPRRLTSEPVGAHGQHPNRRGPRRMDVKSVKLSNSRIILQNDFKIYIKEFLSLSMDRQFKEDLKMVLRLKMSRISSKEKYF